MFAGLYPSNSSLARSVACDSLIACSDASILLSRFFAPCEKGPSSMLFGTSTVGSRNVPKFLKKSPSAENNSSMLPRRTLSMSSGIAARSFSVVEYIYSMTSFSSAVRLPPCASLCRRDLE